MKQALVLLVVAAIPLSLNAWVPPDFSNLNPPGQPYHFELQSAQEGPLLFVNRTGRNTRNVLPEEEYKYNGALLGEVDLIFSGLPPGSYRVILGNAEYRTHNQHNRVMDYYLNGELAYEHYNHFDRFGFRAGGTLELETEAPDGVIILGIRRNLPQSEWPRFAWVRLVEKESGFTVLRTARSFAPRSQEFRDFTARLPQEIEHHEKPPIPTQYKIKPWETDKLTAADIVGPDGIVYPNWLDVGIDGGIPYVPEVLRARDFGAVPDNGKDDSAAIQRALDAAGERGGGAVILEAGEYTLKYPVFIYHSGVVLRGQSPERTTLSFEFHPPERGIELLAIRKNPEGHADPDTQFMAWADFDELETLRWYIGDTELARRDRLRREDYMHFLNTRGRLLIEQVGPGEHLLEAEATYRDGSVGRASMKVNLKDGPVHEHEFGLGHLGAINIFGLGMRGSAYLLKEDGARGSVELRLKGGGSSLAKGDIIDIHAPATERWNELVRNAAPWGNYRRNMLRVMEVNGDRVRVSQPLRLDFPEVDDAYVQRMDCVERSGVESLRIVQPRKLWTSGIILANTWECWIENVRVDMAGRHSYYTNFAKKNEIRNSVFDDVWFKQGGGSGYIGFERAYDSLVDSVITYSMRHAPNLQWAASGNVIRRSHFNDSDGQWHAGWTNENLFEQISVSSGWDNGNYGYGLYSSSPEAGFHGPTGPRNVVYNSDFKAPFVGLWMGGMNENFIIAYNRFINARGPAIYGKHASFNHIIKGNLFVTMEPYPAVFYFASEDCIGIEITDNHIIGPVTVLTGGPAQILVEENNVIERTGDIMRPKPDVPSIFEWQRTHARQQLADRGQAYWGN